MCLFVQAGCWSWTSCIRGGVCWRDSLRLVSFLENRSSLQGSDYMLDYIVLKLLVCRNNIDATVSR